MKDANDQPRAQGMSPVGFAILALWLGLGAALLVLGRPPRILIFAFVMVGWLLSVMAHEFGHALVGYWGGDHTVKDKGYLTFDPRRYADPVTSLGIPILALALGGIGFPGGSVYLRMDLMKSRLWRSAAALAGPGTTFLILIVLAVGLRVWANAGTEGPLFPALSLLAFLQAMALILNMLPLPGLDGFNVIRPFLPKPVAALVNRFGALMSWLVLAAIFFSPEVGRALFQTAAELSIAVGLIPEAIDQGLAEFRFWR
jgi:Zn-dependent protease